MTPIRRCKMSYIPSQASATGLSPRQNTLSGANYSNVVKEHSLKARESLDAGLTIKTREGDLVTLNSSSFAELDAYRYNSKGVAQTQDGTVMTRQNHREVTLSAGDSFSFTVIGDLNEQELEDIEAIVKDIDEIIEEMAQGDMDEAIELALGMGGYDTVSGYSADISYEKTVSRATRVQAQTAATVAPPEPPPELPAQQPVPAVETERPIPEFEPFPENTRPWRKKSRTVKNFDDFIERMTKAVEEHSQEQVARSKAPVEKLFDHHMKKADNEDNDDRRPAMNVIRAAKEKMEDLISELTQGLFSEKISSILDQ